MPGVEVEAFLHGGEAEGGGGGTEFGGGDVVFDVEDGFVGGDEWGEESAFVVGVAFFVDCEVEGALLGCGLFDVVLEPCRQSSGVCGVGEEQVVCGLVCGGEGESGVVGVAVDVVEFDAVEAFLGAEVEAGFHDRGEDVELADVEPFLSWPSVRVAFDRVGERVGVGAELFPAAGR